MKINVSVLASLVLCSCAGDVSVTKSSPPQPTRTASISGNAEVRGAPHRGDRYAAGRVYLVTRPGTENERRGEWRAQGETIREAGSRIEFVELTSGRTISFDAPHQVTATTAESSTPTVQDGNAAIAGVGRGSSL